MAQSLMNRVPLGTGLVTPAAGYGSGSMFVPLTEEEEKAKNEAAFANRMSGILGFYKPGNPVYDYMENVGDYLFGQSLNPLDGQFAKDVYEGSPALKAIGENYDVALQRGVPQIVKKDAQKTEEKLAVPTISSPKRKRGSIRVASGGPQRVTGLGTGKTSYGPDGRLITAGESYKPASQSGRQLTGPMANNPLVPVRPQVKEEEEDNPYDRQFVAKAFMQAYKDSLGKRPFQPYAQGVGTLRNFTALPFFRR
jgi:hypothetical protein